MISHGRITLAKSHHNETIPIFVINLDRRTDRWSRIFKTLSHYDGRVYRYSALNAASQEDLTIAKELDENGICFKDWHSTMGGFCNRFSHIDLLGHIVNTCTMPHFAVIEDDIDIKKPLQFSKYVVDASKELDALQADCFVFSGWDYRPKTPLRRSLLRPGQRISRCECTLGTQLNVYTIAGARKLLSNADIVTWHNLDKAVADLQSAGILYCVGHFRNQFKSFLSHSDVDPGQR